MPDPGRPRPGTTRLLRGALALSVALLALAAAWAVLGTEAPTAPSGRLVPATSEATPGPSLSTGQGPTGLSLSISVTPGQICLTINPGCPTDERSARVTLTAAAPPEVELSWPAVQVVFVLETTIYDGAYDGSDGVPGTEQCADSSLHEPCEESNMLPFFLANSGDIAATIAAANPHSNVSFGLVDYFSTGDTYDDQSTDGGLSDSYHVDVGTTVPASQFQTDVRSSFQYGVLGGGWVLPDADFADNFLHSDSITALYGALMGYGIDWSPTSHHVLVLITSTAPRDPSYVQDYCVSSSADWQIACYGGQGPFSSSCEPSYDFGYGTSPSCEGWIYPQGGNPNASIADLTRSSPDCVQSLGHRCTIDVVDLWTTPTDPYSAGWPSAHNGGPGGPDVVQNAQRVLTAGCDLAQATNGTWDGPSYFACPDGQVGDLDYVAYGSVGTPQTQNPSLFGAFHGVGFGPVENNLVALGANESMFHYVPFANVRAAPELNPKTICLTAVGPRAICPDPTGPNATTGAQSVNWNWSYVPADNDLRTGDLWIASFDVVAVGPPYGTVPVDACTTADCAAGGSGPAGGTFTSARYLNPANGALVVQSFPLASLKIVFGPLPTVLNPPPPASIGTVPVGSPPSPPLVAPATPVSTPATTVATVSIQAIGAGFLGAGFTRVAQKNRPVAVGQANIIAKPKGGGGARRPKRPPPGRAFVGRFV